MRVAESQCDKRAVRRHKPGPGGTGLVSKPMPIMAGSRTLCAVALIGLFGQTPASPGPSSAAIDGRVIDAATRQPIAGATVSLRQAGGAGSTSHHASVVTDGSGGFVFGNLPASPYEISATAMGYLSGEVWPTRVPGYYERPAVGAGERLVGLVIELARPGRIGGVVIDAANQPVGGALVRAWRRRTFHGQLRLDREAPFARTDAEGRYVIVPPPGDYVVGLVGSGGAPPAAENDVAPQVFESQYFPGVIDPASASVVTVDAGGERLGIDFALRPAQVAAVAGRVERPVDRPTAGATVTLRRPWHVPSQAVEARVRLRPDGGFTMPAVPIGPYVLEVELSEIVSYDVTTRMSDDVTTRLEIDVPREGVRDLIVPIARGLELVGSLSLDGDATPPHDPRVYLRRLDRPVADFGPYGRIENGVVKVSGIEPGRYVLQTLAVAPDKTQWYLADAHLDGRDVTGRAFDVHAGIGGQLDLRLTSRPTVLSGRVLRDGYQQPTDHARIVLFPVDDTVWSGAILGAPAFPLARAMGGTFTVTGPPPGAYFVAAVDEAAMDDWPNTSFFAAARRQAERVVLTAGAQTAVTLRLRK